MFFCADTTSKEGTGGYVIFTEQRASAASDSRQGSGIISQLPGVIGEASEAVSA